MLLFSAAMASRISHAELEGESLPFAVSSKNLDLGQGACGACGGSRCLLSRGRGLSACLYRMSLTGSPVGNGSASLLREKFQ